MKSDPSISASVDRGGLIGRSDMALHNQDWTENVIGKVSEWIDLDSTEINIRYVLFFGEENILFIILNMFVFCIWFFDFLF